ncbi:unnamed protein product [Ambrosiozyma monospora]|uniref:Unnamed protein product n=1 Tax=Ambrosiozyma monospora TaxID=43982 RepID=A0A9W7DHT6_AMBMO|nr:unnamed protein product [Ambrosiozyma monospora]
MKICLLGDDNSGKTSLIATFLRINDYIEPTVEDVYQRRVEIEGQEYLLEMQDTINDSFTDRTQLIQNSDVVILCFSIVDEVSYHDISMHLSTVNNSIDHYKPVPVMLVGNQADKEGFRQVSPDAARQLVRNEHLQRYVETSAKTGINVDKCFQIAIELAVKFKKNPKAFQADYLKKLNKSSSSSPSSSDSRRRSRRYSSGKELSNMNIDTTTAAVSKRQLSNDDSVSPGATSKRSMENSNYNNQIRSRGLDKGDGSTSNTRGVPSSPVGESNGCCAIM